MVVTDFNGPKDQDRCVETASMSSEIYFAYLLATIVIVIVPGPTVTLIVANALTHGTRAGLLNVAGTQAGLAVCIAIVAVGLASLVQAIGWWFDWLRIVGAAYLIWIGWKLIRSTGEIDMSRAAREPRGGFLLQGFLVMLSNPKTLFFFGAFLPQFIDPARDYLMQIAIMGPTAMLVALASDGFYAIAVGRARGLLTQRRVRFINRASGACLIGGGVWLALSRSR
jgi:homoserine/homoserine lactone efflux protein